MPTWNPKPLDSAEHFTLDMVRNLGEGDAIQSATCGIEAIPPTADQAAGTMLLGEPEINGTTVAQKVGGGVPGARYRLTFTIETLHGETLTPDGDFFVGGPAPSPRDLAGLREVKDWLGVKHNDDDVLLQRLITFESATIEKHLGRPVLLQTRTDTVISYGSTTFMPPMTPIVDIEQVSIGGVTLPVDFDKLTVWRRDGGQWPRNARIKITYTAGFGEIPFDIEQACIELVGFHYKERDRIGHSSKSLGGETVSYITRAMPFAVEARLAPYRKVAPC